MFGCCRVVMFVVLDDFFLLIQFFLFFLFFFSFSDICFYAFHSLSLTHTLTHYSTGCVLAWNLGLPLLQPHLRRHAHRAFNIAATSLEEVDSQSLKSLRAKLHFEIAKTEVAR